MASPRGSDGGQNATGGLDRPAQLRLRARLGLIGVSGRITGRQRPLPSYDGTQTCATATGETARAFLGEHGTEPGAAKALCLGCPFVTDCALYGLTNDVHGVWGSLDDRDRAEARHHGIAPAPQPVSAQLDFLVTAIRYPEPPHRPGVELDLTA